MGNGYGVDANEYSLTKLEPDVPFGFTSGLVEKELSLQRLVES